MSARVLFGVIALLAGPAMAGEAGPCALTGLGTATVQNVLDHRTIRLNDRREVRIAGIEVPDQRARFALEGMLAARPVALARLGAETDRYGRLLAVVSPGTDTATIANSAQGMLLAQGLAQVSGRVGDAGCAATLREIEQKARTAGLGLWADPHYVVRHAEDFAAILAMRGRFAVVEGKVLSVRESGGTIYVNFGRRWSEDFTVTVPKRSERSFTAAGLPLRKLAGRNVRVRGTIEERGGPWIEASAPEQIEVVEHD